MVALLALLLLDVGSLSQGEEDVCSLPLRSGPCLAHFRVWGYNPTSGRCESFIYGGCGGNENRFEDKAECERACVESSHLKKKYSFLSGEKEDICSLPIVTGPCRAGFKVWGFNATSVVQCLEPEKRERNRPEVIVPVGADKRNASSASCLKLHHKYFCTADPPSESFGAANTSMQLTPGCRRRPRSREERKSSEQIT
ncbi:hypothetical protein TcWFU_007895 [Taenia crassiceps]|uniref:BPTI/Kunitz inhibitor domain-containing protein n=1 Tax=Taenia crassiceps TaxID=6207 RepID=A0ABR4QBD1_9CEST